MKVRKQEHVDELKEKILCSAKEIIKEEGLDQLSMRKIAKNMDYTVGILYHYFKDKDEILFVLAQQRYIKLVELLKICMEKSYEMALDQLEATLRAYIEFMLQDPQIFQILLVEDLAMLREHVNILKKGISEQRNSMAMLVAVLKKGTSEGSMHITDYEQHAQIIWCSTYGLLQRLLIEKPNPKLKMELIDKHLEIIRKGAL